MTLPITERFPNEYTLRAQKELVEKYEAYRKAADEFFRQFDIYGSPADQLELTDDERFMAPWRDWIYTRSGLDHEVKKECPHVPVTFD